MVFKQQVVTPCCLTASILVPLKLIHNLLCHTASWIKILSPYKIFSLKKINIPLSQPRANALFFLFKWKIYVDITLACFTHFVLYYCFFTIHRITVIFHCFLSPCGTCGCEELHSLYSSCARQHNKTTLQN